MVGVGNGENDETGDVRPDDDELLQLGVEDVEEFDAGWFGMGRVDRNCAERGEIPCFPA